MPAVADFHFRSPLPTAATLAAVLAACLMASGCPATSVRGQSLPDRFEVEYSDLMIHSDLKLQKSNPVLVELESIRDQVKETLELPPSRRPVVVYLFSDETRYQSYMSAAYPSLPARRAFFIGSPTELGVYAHWSEKMGEDLRHEYTHGVLHASLKKVPLWFDEGLAEYFETPLDNVSHIHPEHTPRLKQALKNGWRPDITRLEKIEEVTQMRREDYQEAWSWIHYLLHEAPEGRQILIEYCQALHKSGEPPRFSQLLHSRLPDAEVRLASYLSLSLH